MIRLSDRPEALPGHPLARIPTIEQGRLDEGVDPRDRARTGVRPGQTTTGVGEETVAAPA